MMTPDSTRSDLGTFPLRGISKLLAAFVLGNFASLSPAMAESTARASEPAPNEAFEWRTGYEDSLEEAAGANKNVLLRFTADWCPPCQIMNRNVWPENEVQSAVAEDFVPVEIDIDKASNRAVAMRYGIRGIPTLVLVDPDGNEMARTGFMSASELVAFLKQAGG